MQLITSNSNLTNLKLQVFEKDELVWGYNCDLLSLCKEKQHFYEVIELEAQFLIWYFGNNSYQIRSIYLLRYIHRRPYEEGMGVFSEK